VPGSSLFLNRHLAPVLLFSCCLLLQAQVRKVDPQKTITFEVIGATAAYTLDDSLAEATADNGLVSVTGKQPGATHIVVITPSGVQTFDVLVTTPPPHYPPGFVMPVSVAEMAQSGYYEGRYYSSPAQVQNQLDFLKIHGDDRTHVHLVETNLVGPLERGQTRTALSSASYQFVTPRRDITLLDQYVDESQLTLNGSIIRGFHMQQDNWFVHTGYTTVATFQGLFLPTQPELVLGGGYHYPLTANSSITASFYHFQIPTSEVLGHSGNVSTVSYEYSPRETFSLTADAGISHGIGAAGRLSYKTERDTVAALVRYMPLRFASLGANNLRGLHTDLSWTRHVTKEFDVALTFYNNNVVLPNMTETTISGAANLHYQLSRHWALTGGAIASSFKVPPSLAIRSFTLPAGLAFQSTHFGATGQYQFAVTPGRESAGKQLRASVRSGWAAFAFTGYAERDTNAPTLNFIFGQVAGLQQILDQLGIRATTIQQVDELLSSNSFLIAAGYIKGATINLVPVRTQIGGTVDWSGTGVHRQQLSYSFLFNDNQSLQGSTEDVGHTLSYSRSVSRSDDLSMACSILGVKNPGRSQQYTPICFVAWRHQFDHVPYFIVPERHGTITGNVFRDDQSKGVLEPGMLSMPEVEVMLDDRLRTLTRIDGSYRFPNVPRGKHRIVARYGSREPFFFTTPSDLEVDEDATVNFGIGHLLSGLMGQVLNDAGQGIAGVMVMIRSRGLKWSAATEADGSFFVSSLAAGDYSVQIDAESLPAGYSTEAIGEPQRVTVGASSPGKAAFTERAFRSISGCVLSYDSLAARYIPVINAQVTLHEPGLNTMTDLTGRYLFRDLTAGSYTISVQNDVHAFTHTVRLGAPPVDLINVDFQINTTGPPDVPAPEGSEASVVSLVPLVLPVKPQPLAANALDSISVTAQQHNIIGRQLSKGGRYRAAVVELNQALRIAPGFALAFNARGYALFMLHDWARAIEDLDAAIRLNPSYGNAYRIRAVAKRSIGDMLGAAADLKRSRQSAQ
jgi:hypothetical protein